MLDLVMVVLLLLMQLVLVAALRRAISEALPTLSGRVAWILDGMYSMSCDPPQRTEAILELDVSGSLRPGPDAAPLSAVRAIGHTMGIVALIVALIETDSC